MTAWTVESLVAASAWTAERCRGFLDARADLANGVRREPWRGSRAAGAVSDVGLADPRDRWLLGYREAAAWAELAPAADDLSGESPETLRRIASGYACTEDEEGDVAPGDAAWSFVADYPLEALLGKMGGRDQWLEWLRDESRFSMEEGRAGYGYLLVQDIREPVVLVEVDGRPLIWDGWHRIAAAVVKGQRAIGAVVGHPKPAPVCAPGR
jgi:hypothetical protein